mmetsp:Transcript_9688/g.36368  ORF Transcript_9688/g.36368 Transcript_9688/m.36368 type:complete len:354 (-) Transcript_9688:1143-2204(-)
MTFARLRRWPRYSSRGAAEKRANGLDELNPQVGHLRAGLRDLLQQHLFQLLAQVLHQRRGLQPRHAEVQPLVQRDDLLFVMHVKRAAEQEQSERIGRRRISQVHFARLHALVIHQVAALQRGHDGVEADGAGVEIHGAFDGLQGDLSHLLGRRVLRHDADVRVQPSADARAHDVPVGAVLVDAGAEVRLVPTATIPLRQEADLGEHLQKLHPQLVDPTQGEAGKEVALREGLLGGAASLPHRRPLLVGLEQCEMVGVGHSEAAPSLVGFLPLLQRRHERRALRHARCHRHHGVEAVENGAHQHDLADARLHGKRRQMEAQRREADALLLSDAGQLQVHSDAGHLDGAEVPQIA